MLWCRHKSTPHLREGNCWWFCRAWARNLLAKYCNMDAYFYLFFTRQGHVYPTASRTASAMTRTGALPSTLECKCEQLSNIQRWHSMHLRCSPHPVRPKSSPKLTCEAAMAGAECGMAFGPRRRPHSKLACWLFEIVDNCVASRSEVESRSAPWRGLEISTHLYRITTYNISTCDSRN